MKDIENMSEDVQSCLKLFNSVLPWRMKLQEILKLLGPTEDCVCLEIAAHNGGMSYYLRKRGGEWHTVVTSQASMDAVKRVVGGDVHMLVDGRIPFEDNTFHKVVVVDLLEITDSDSAFVEECHRVLKEDGQLIINVARYTALSLINPLRKMLARELHKEAELYLGYSEPELFTLLKHGFDVHAMRKYSRFLVEFVDTVVRLIVVRGGADNEGRGVYAGAAFFYWLAYQIDLILFFFKGHHLLASA
ncbi:hypothetical protein BVX97_00350, partial [bacterium E08(2017)]